MSVRSCESGYGVCVRACVRSCVCFCALFEKKTQYQFKLSIYGFDIERVPCIKFSGVIIDDNFIWRQHMIEHTSKKMSSSIEVYQY